MAKRSYIKRWNKSNNKSELQAKGDSVVLTSYKKFFADGVPVGIIKNTEEVSMGENNKLNKNFVSELQAKGDSVVLTKYKELEDNILTNYEKVEDLVSMNFEEISLFSEDAVIAEVLTTTSENKSEGCLSPIIQSLRKKLEKFREKHGMLKELKDLEHSLEKLKNEEKHLSEMCTKLIKLQETEKNEFEKVYKDYASTLIESLENASNSSKLEYDEQSFTKVGNDYYDYEIRSNPSFQTISSLDYDMLDDKESEEELEMVR